MFSLILIAAIAGLVWSGVYLRYTGMWGLCLAILLAGTIFGHAFFHVSLVTLDRVMLAIAVAAFLCLRWRGNCLSHAWNASDWLLAGLIGILSLSTFAHEWQIKGMLPLSRLLFFYAAPAAMYCLARATPLTSRRLTLLYGAFAALGIYLAVASLAERFSLDAIVLPRYIVDPTHAEFLGRGRGPLLNPCGNGILMTACLCCIALLIPRASRASKLLLLGLVLLMLAGLYGTLTRSVWIGGGLSLLMLLTIGIPRQWRMPAVAIAMTVSGMVVGATWQQVQAFKRDKNVSVEDMRDSASLRPILAAVAWGMFQDYPLLGVGYGQYRVRAVEYLGDRTVDLPLEKARPYVQHNVFLSLLTETGVVGAGLFILLLISWTETAWRLWRREHLPLEARQLGLVLLCTLIAYVVNGLFHEVTIIPMIHMYLFFLAGAARNVAAVECAEEYLPAHNRLTWSNGACSVA